MKEACLFMNHCFQTWTDKKAELYICQQSHSTSVNYKRLAMWVVKREERSFELCDLLQDGPNHLYMSKSAVKSVSPEPSAKGAIATLSQ